TFTTAFVDSGSEASFTVPTDQSLSEGQWTWKARAIDSRGAEGEWSGERIFWITSSRRFISLGIGRAEDVSRDGSVVVGITETPEHYNRAFVWRKEEGELIEIGTLSGTDSLALSVSGDGEKVVGISTTSDGRSLPFIWTVGEGIKALDSLEGGAWDISDDGSSIVGSDEFGAVIWKSGTRQRIVDGGIAKGISHDGKVVVGEMMTDRGPRAFRWANGILQDLGTLGGDLSTALRVSSNGNIVVGYSKNAQGKHRAFRWTIDGVMHDLGTLGGSWSEARDVSANGEVIVGISETKEGRSHAFLWTPTTGMQDLNQVFAQYIPQGFELVSADGISYDGRYIVGSAFSPDGKIVAFWLDTGVTTQNKPDLIPVELTLSKSEVLAGDKLTISFKVVNQGSAKANASKTNVRLSKNADKPSPNDPLLAQLDTPALEPNESVTHSREVTIPNDTEIGDYYVWVIVDADSTVGQSDETNDRINTPLKVIVIEAAIDAKLLELIDKYATRFYKKEWNVTLNQFKLWIATIAWGEAGLGGYGAHSQGNPSYNGDVFYHKDVDKSFRFSTGIGYFQLDRGGLQWDNWPTIEKLNPEKAVESVMKWHYNKFGKKATLDDFSKESAWNAVKPGKVETRWRQVTGTSWNDPKDKGKDLDWVLRKTILADQAKQYPHLRQEANFTYLGKKRWSVTEGDQVKTDSGKQVVFNGDCDTWLVNARAWDGTLLFSYYYTYDPNNGIEIWAWKDDPKYIFVREYGTRTGGQFPDGRIKDTNKAGFTLEHFAVDKDKGPLLTASSQYNPGNQRLRYRIFAPLGSVSKLANRQAGLMVIVNPLDRNLDEQTVQFEGVSHPTALIEQSVDLGRREVQWRFQLANVDADQVWVQFSVLPKSDVPSGERIINRALVKVEETQSETNEIVTIIDKAPPQVSLQPLPPVQPKPVFEIQWETDDDVSGVSEVEVWVSDNGAAPEFWASFIPMMTQATFKGKFGHEYRFYSVAVDKAGNRSPIPDQPQAVTKAGQAPSIQRGLRIVSLPVISEISDPKQVFNFDGDKWAWYDPTVTDPNQRYIRYPDARAGLQVGKGFWARFGQDVTPNAKGDLPDDTQPFAIALKGGSWNLIGNPWLSDLTWDVSAIQVKIGAQTKPLNDLQPGEGVEPYAWRWDGSQYQLVFDSKLLTGVG
ncbi:MAG: CARDB domain-containing protein, partial [Candidatus Bathyarchaeia archaeon]